MDNNTKKLYRSRVDRKIDRKSTRLNSSHASTSSCWSWSLKSLY